MNNIMKTEEYTGTKESAQDLVTRLYIEDYHSFNVLNGILLNLRDGVMYRRGDYYHYAIPEEFKAI